MENDLTRIAEIKIFKQRPINPGKKRASSHFNDRELLTPAVSTCDPL